MTNQQIRDKVGRPAIAEQAAEEAAELGKEALKYARAIRGENPTPIAAGGQLPENERGTVRPACCM